MSLGTLILRGVVGGLFVGHGLQKLRGSFGGPGIEGASAMMESLEMAPGRRNALAASIAETAGGAALIAGAATPLASAAIIGTMVTAIRKVHMPNGLWSAKGGYEYNVVLIAALTLLAEGPGKISLDAIAGKSRWGAGWALFALGAGVAGSTAVIELGKREAATRNAAAQSADAAI